MEFTIKTEVNGLENFKAWSGGKDRLDRIIELGVVTEAEGFIYDCLGEEMTETELNDFLWFEMDEFIEEYEGEE